MVSIQEQSRASLRATVLCSPQQVGTSCCLHVSLLPGSTLFLPPPPSNLTLRSPNQRLWLCPQCIANHWLWHAGRFFLSQQLFPCLLLRLSLCVNAVCSSHCPDLLRQKCPGLPQDCLPNFLAKPSRLGWLLMQVCGPMTTKSQFQPCWSLRFPHRSPWISKLPLRLMRWYLPLPVLGLFCASFLPLHPQSAGRLWTGVPL